MIVERLHYRVNCDDDRDSIPCLSHICKITLYQWKNSCDLQQIWSVLKKFSLDFEFQQTCSRLDDIQSDCISTSIKPLNIDNPISFTSYIKNVLLVWWIIVTHDQVFSSILLCNKVTHSFTSRHTKQQVKNILYILFSTYNPGFLQHSSHVKPRLKCIYSNFSRKEDRITKERCGIIWEDLAHVNVNTFFFADFCIIAAGLALNGAT